MLRAFLVPLRIDVVAEILNQLGHAERFGWRVLATVNLNSTRPPIPGIRIEACQRDSLQCLQLRRPKAKRPLWIKVVLDHFNNGLKLLQTILNFALRTKHWIADQFSARSVTVALRV